MNDSKLVKLSLDQVMSDRFGRYSKYVIQDRALPDARDGLKPVQRRILFSMAELGLYHSKPFKKSARVVGDVIGKYHPHGDSSIYEAMVRMSQDWKMNFPLIEMHGNNGSIDDDPAAAMRYTEARLSKTAKLMLDNIKKSTVKFAPNFDDSEREPTVLPGLLPNLLINGAKGIASGFATEMPPHNLGEIIDGIITRIKSPNCRLDTITNIIKGPDFPTGGIVQGRDGIYQAFERGRGRIVIKSKIQVTDTKTSPSILITEIPYGVVKSKLVREIDDIRFSKTIHGIKEVLDISDRNSLGINIELIPGTQPNKIVNYLLSKTSLQVYYSYNNIAIHNNAPILMGIIDLIDSYIKHQTIVQKSALKFELRKDKSRLEIVDGLIKVVAIVDKVIAVIRSCEGSKQAVILKLSQQFDFSEVQAAAIAELRLYRLSRTDQKIYLEEKNILETKIKNYENILASDESFNLYLISQLKNVKKEFAKPRKTLIEDKVGNIDYNVEELIKHEDSWIGVSRQGYIKRFSNKLYMANDILKYGLKEQDNIVYMSYTNTANKLLVFTNKGHYIFIPQHKILDAKWGAIGAHINDFATISVGEFIVGVISVADFSKKAFVTLVSKSGKAKRVKIESFEVSRYSKALVAMKLKDDEVIGVKTSNGQGQIVIINNHGKAVKYAETNISIYGTKGGGIKAISIRGTDYVTSFVIGTSKQTIGMISKRGGLKRIKFDAILPMARTTQGRNIYKTLKGNPHIILDAAIVEPNTQILFKTSKNILQLFAAKIVDITNVDSGFSSIGSSQIVDGKIMTFDDLIKGSRAFETITPNDESDTFTKAEKTIEKISQINIDDILDNL